MKKKIIISIIMLIMPLIIIILMNDTTKVREVSGIELTYEEPEYYSIDDEIKIFLKGTDEELKNCTLNANSVTVKVGEDIVNPTTKQVTSSTTSHSDSEVVMLVTLSGFDKLGLISLEISADTLEDNDGNFSVAKTITTENYVQYPSYGLEGSGAMVTLTRENYAQYLGKKISNYKTLGSTEKITPPTKGSEIEVSTTYRLYYIDWDNKYGDGAGTVYLKADTGSTNIVLPTSLAYNTTTSKIQAYNPSLYKSGVTTPTTTNSNMKAVTWLLDTNEWNGLKTSGNSTTIGSYVKHVVGSPPFEMFCDSYNAHYGLTSGALTMGNGSTSTRRKIFYLYPYNSSNYGYAVGPGYQSGDTANYDTSSARYLVLSDGSIDSMYYPGEYRYYWLASPAASGGNYVLYMHQGQGGYTDDSGVGSSHGVNPLVALESNVNLILVD